MNSEKSERVCVLKWKVENFGFFYIKNFDSLSFIHSSPYSLPFVVDNNNQKPIIALRLYPNGVGHGQNDLSLNMHMLSEAKLDVKRCEVYLQDFKLENQLIKSVEKIHLSNECDFLLENFIQQQQIYENGYLVRDVLTIICQLYIAEDRDETECIFEPIFYNKDELESRSNARVKVSRVAQEWKIEKFETRLEHNERIQSFRYNWNNTPYLSYFLLLGPNEIESSNSSTSISDHVSLELFIKLANNVDLKAQSQISICDRKNGKHNTKVIHGQLVPMGIKDFCCPKYILREIAKKFAQHEGTLTIFCEIEVFEEEEVCEMSNSHHEATFSTKFKDMNITLTINENSMSTQNNIKEIRGSIASGNYKIFNPNTAENGSGKRQRHVDMNQPAPVFNMAGVKATTIIINNASGDNNMSDTTINK